MEREQLERLTPPSPAATPSSESKGTERALALDEKTGRILWAREWEVNYSGIQYAYDLVRPPPLTAIVCTRLARTASCSASTSRPVRSFGRTTTWRISARSRSRGGFIGASPVHQSSTRPASLAWLEANRTRPWSRLTR